MDYRALSDLTISVEVKMGLLVAARLVIMIRFGTD